MFTEKKKTKIVATIGPVSDTPEKIERLLQLGVNVFRFNMKHNTVAWHEERINLVNSIAKKLDKSVGILVDLQGPELRLETADKLPVLVKKGEEVVVGLNFDVPNAKIVLAEKSVYTTTNVGDQFLIDDGFGEFSVVWKGVDHLVIISNEDYSISHRKGVNLPGANLEFSSLIPADLDKLDMATRVKVDFVALSFCRSKSDLDLLKAEIAKRNLKVQIVAKIENGMALRNIEEITSNADAVMVARGDLGVESPIEELAGWQKRIVKICRFKHKPVIVATQMLQSMIENPRPTRAEATDVSNAVWDGTDAVMLSGESASGKYPEKAVEAMAKIVAFNETVIEDDDLELTTYDSTEAVVSSAISLARHQASVRAIVVFTDSGTTAKVLSSFRPKLPIIAIAHDPKVADLLSLSFGVTPLRKEFPTGEFKIPTEVIELLEKDGILKKGDDVIIVHGSQWHEPGATNAMALVKV